VNRSGRRRLPALWRRLRLWPRLAIGVTIGFVGLFAGFSILGIRAVDASTERILHERLAVASELADDFDRMLQHRFSDLAAFDARPASPSVERRLLSEVHHASGGDFTTVLVLDGAGRVLVALGRGAPPVGARVSRRRYLAPATAGAGRGLSEPFHDRLGRPVVALSVPIHVGGLARVVAGTLDLTGPDILEPLDAARRLGRTGHAELVGSDGIALASTEPGVALAPGEHLAFYRKMLAAPRPGIETVPVTPAHREPIGLGHQRHVMAFVRLSTAPWGVALGGTESDTYAPANQLRQTLILAGGGSLALLWLLTLLGARLLVRPVRHLTRAAEKMASGDLERNVRVSEGGEIGVLAASLETMRSQLRDSLVNVRRWGEELEVEVASRTAELNARNRQLAAVGAILTAANETRDLEGLLQRCLDVVLEQMAVDAAAVRLLDEGRDQPMAAFARGAWRDFPCRGCTRQVCLAATSESRPVYVDPGARTNLHAACTVPGEALAVLPLRGPNGVLGVLTIGRRRGQLPTLEEDPVLAAICDQIAAAIENAQLAAELGRLEAQHEVQRMRSELISAVSHELRTPLGFIKSYATTLLREDAPIASATRRHFLEIIDEETDKLEHMIGELLDASRLQAGRLPIEREPLALKPLIARVVDKARPTLEAGGHVITLRLPAADVPVLADPLRIEQVLDNLLENAARYSEPRSPLEISLLAEDEHAMVTVANRAQEMPATELERVFEPFYRGGGAKQRGVRGAGLGLAICRGIVEAHGGKMWGEQGADRRIGFVFSLPLVTGQGA